MTGYLGALDRLLAAGASGLSPGFIERQVEFVVAQQLPDGGFRGRQGGSDPYYTDFALRILALLASGREAVIGAAGYVRTLRERTGAACGRSSLVDGARFPTTLDGCGWHTVVECFSYLNALRILRACGAEVNSPAGNTQAGQATRDPVRIALERRPPSPYDAFLAALCLDCLGEESPLVAEAARAVAELQAVDGGFAATSGDGAAQTSLTAAAVGLLQMAGCLADEAGAAAARFLAAMQAPDGGLRAHPLAPAGDLLSTFTGLLTLFGLEEMDALDTAGVARFVRAAATPGGGFTAGPGDEEPDVEYTYYGLGAICLLRVFALVRQ